jgi:hypothetical protein
MLSKRVFPNQLIHKMISVEPLPTGAMPVYSISIRDREIQTGDIVIISYHPGSLFEVINIREVRNVYADNTESNDIFYTFKDLSTYNLFELATTAGVGHADPGYITKWKIDNGK